MQQDERPDCARGDPNVNPFQPHSEHQGSGHEVEADPIAGTEGSIGYRHLGEQADALNQESTPEGRGQAPEDEAVLHSRASEALTALTRAFAGRTTDKLRSGLLMTCHAALVQIEVLDALRSESRRRGQEYFPDIPESLQLPRTLVPLPASTHAGPVYGYGSANFVSPGGDERNGPSAAQAAPGALQEHGATGMPAVPSTPAGRGQSASAEAQVTLEMEQAAGSLHMPVVPGGAAAAHMSPVADDGVCAPTGRRSRESSVPAPDVVLPGEHSRAVRGRVRVHAEPQLLSRRRPTQPRAEHVFRGSDGHPDCVAGDDFSAGPVHSAPVPVPVGVRVAEADEGRASLEGAQPRCASDGDRLPFHAVSASSLRGVTLKALHSGLRRYEAQLVVTHEMLAAVPALGGKSNVYLGVHASQEEAGAAVDRMRLKLLGPEGALWGLNFPLSNYHDEMASLEFNSMSWEEYGRLIVSQAEGRAKMKGEYIGVRRRGSESFQSRKKGYKSFGAFSDALQAARVYDLGCIVVAKQTGKRLRSIKLNFGLDEYLDEQGDFLPQWVGMVPTVVRQA